MAEQSKAEPGGGLEVGETMYAWITDVPDGTTTVVGAMFMHGGQLMHMPLVGMKRSLIEDLRAIAESHRITTGQPVRLVRFGLQEVLEALP